MTYERRNTLGETLELLSLAMVRPILLAGGTDFMVQLRRGVVPEALVLLIDHLPELRGIGIAGDNLRIGAGCSIETIRTDPVVAANLPWLATCLNDFAAPQIRNRATLGGNIANGSPTADTIPPLLVLNAELELASMSGIRSVALESFFTGYKQNRLDRDEMILAVNIPLQEGTTSHKPYWRKVSMRNALSIAKVSCAMMMNEEAGVLTGIRIAAGSLSIYPKRLIELESALTGRAATSVMEDEILALLRNEVTPISDFRSDADYRLEVFARLVCEGLGLYAPTLPKEDHSDCDHDHGECHHEH